MPMRIGTEMPSFEGATEWFNATGAHAAAAAKHGITEPCAVDNEHKLRDAFQNEQGYVPAYYLFDAEGRLRGFAAGEFGLKVIGPALDRVLAANKAAAG